MQTNLRGTDAIVEWFPLQIASDLTIGTLNEGTWVVHTAEGVVRLDHGRAFAFVLQLLELTHDGFEELILTHRRSHRHVGNFPTKELLLTAFEHGPYWIEKSLAWLDSTKIEDDFLHTVIERLERISIGRRYDQKLRHQTRSLANELKVNAGTRKGERRKGEA